MRRGQHRNERHPRLTELGASLRSPALVSRSVRENFGELMAVGFASACKPDFRCWRLAAVDLPLRVEISYSALVSEWPLRCGFLEPSRARWDGKRTLRKPSSSPTWRDPPRMSPSTTSAAPESSGSRKEKARSSGHDCHAALSPPMRFAFSFMRSPTISANFLRTLAMPDPIKDWSLTILK
jgi:hypothetical protein